MNTANPTRNTTPTLGVHARPQRAGGLRCATLRQFLRTSIDYLGTTRENGERTMATLARCA